MLHFVSALTTWSAAPWSLDRCRSRLVESMGEASRSHQVIILQRIRCKQSAVLWAKRLLA